jgi:hypothetical protein
MYTIYYEMNIYYQVLRQFAISWHCVRSPIQLHLNSTKEEAILTGLPRTKNPRLYLAMASPNPLLSNHLWDQFQRLFPGYGRLHPSYVFFSNESDLYLKEQTRKFLTCPFGLLSPLSILPVSLPDALRVPSTPPIVHRLLLFSFLLF